MDKKLRFRRVSAVLLILLCFVGLMSATAYHQATGGSGTQKRGELTPIPAARGEVVDTNGIPLIVNRQSNNVIFRAGLFPSRAAQEERNEVILALIKLLDSQKIPWLDTLPITLNKSGKPRFVKERDRDITWLKSREMLNLNDYATAQDCFTALVQRFGLDGYSVKNQRKLASVNAALFQDGFRLAQPYTFAVDVPSEIIAKIKEQSAVFHGVDVEIVPVREYAVKGDIMPHILGRIGALDPDEYERLKNQGYRMNDVIGKSGIEKEMESELRGKEGRKLITQNRDGSLSEEIIEPPVQGNTIVLNIDLSLQEWLMTNFGNFLENDLRNTRLSYAAGSAIIMNPNTGAVLACVSYPTYDITTFAKDLKKLSKDKTKPLWDRALMSAYPPGSTIKPSIAATALEEGIITTSTTFHCRGSFNAGGNRFNCITSHLHPANVNVNNSIVHSCNTFYYNLAVKLGINKLNEYRSLFGFGQKTGIELPEMSGILDSPEYREALGQPWQLGYTVQAGIAQGANQFTPIQLANYVSTVANGGTRYVPHVVKEIKSYNLSETILSKEPEIGAVVPVSEKNMKIVQESMKNMANSIPNRLGNTRVQIAAKTGTNQRSVSGFKKTVSDGLLVAYGPYENPEISVVIFAELADKSATVVPFAGRLFNYYFSRSASFPKPQAEGVLLG